MKGNLSKENEDEGEILKTLLRKPDPTKTLYASKNSPAYMQWCCHLQEKAVPVQARMPEISNTLRIGGEYLKVNEDTVSQGTRLSQHHVNAVCSKGGIYN